MENKINGHSFIHSFIHSSTHTFFLWVTYAVLSMVSKNKDKQNFLPYPLRVHMPRDFCEITVPLECKSSYFSMSLIIDLCQIRDMKYYIKEI